MHLIVHASVAAPGVVVPAPAGVLRTCWSVLTVGVQVGGLPFAGVMIPRGGPAIAIFVAAIFVAVMAAVVAMETGRRSLAWAAIGFVVTIVLAVAGYAVA